MPGLTESQITGLKTLFAVANDQVVRSIEAALAEDAGRGGAIAAVHGMAAREAAERKLRALVLGPVIPLCRPSSWSAVSFPAKTPALLWAALRESEPERVAAAAAVAEAPPPKDPDEPPSSILDELCHAAAQGLRSEAPAFQAANTLLNGALKDGGALFASYLDLSPIARSAIARLPEWVIRMTDERAAAARLAYKDAVALSDDAGPQLFEILFAQLPEPWQILRVMSAIMDHPGDRYVAASELSRFGEYLLADIDKRLAAFKAFDAGLGAEAGAAAADSLALAAQQIAEFETAMELSRDGPWGARIAQHRQLLAGLAEARLEQIEKAIDQALPLRMVRLGKGLKGLPNLRADPDPAALRRAEGLMAFFDRSRSSAGQSGYGSARAKVGEMLGDRLDHYVEDLLEMLRADDVDSVERIHAYLEVAAVFTGQARDEKAAQIVRRRAAAA